MRNEVSVEIDRPIEAGAVHDAMAAWIRVYEPSRPIHYQGAIGMAWIAFNNKAFAERGIKIIDRIIYSFKFLFFNI